MRRFSGILFSSIAGVFLLSGISPDLRGQTPTRGSRIQPHDGGVPPEDVPDSFRSRIYRGLDEERPFPDVLVLKNSRKIEAYFLQAYGNRFVFYVKESERSWVREEIPRSAVSSVLYEQYLERDPTEPRLIRVARKQPVRKRNVLAGRFSGVQDRYTTWQFTFHSETNKPLPYSEDATEYGTFVIESRRSMPQSRYTNSTWSMGNYYLYAPHTVNNDAWALSLTGVAHAEKDRTDHVSWLSRSLPDEIFIVQFSEDDKFRLQWSNLSSGAWTILPQVQFQRDRNRGRSRTPAQRSVPGSLGSGGRIRLVGTTPPTFFAGDPTGADAGRWRDVDPAYAWVSNVGTSNMKSLRRIFVSKRMKRVGSRVEGWKRPNSYWDG